MPALPAGKLPVDVLRDLLARYGTDAAADPRVILGPGVGEDAAVIDFGQRCLVAKTDPVTYATDEIGWYAAHVSANDVACCGGMPRWYLACVLLPEGQTTVELAEAIFAQLAEGCRQLGVSLCGGHTEVVPGLPRPIVVGQMLGEVAAAGCVTTGGAQLGDRLILTKGIAIEGTAILAREKGDELRGVLPDAELTRCAAMLHEPGISVVRDAQVAIGAGGVHALHDPTEGGLATGLWELSEAAGVGLTVDLERLPVLPQCRTLCEHLALDPLGLIASGCLLIAAEPERADAIVERLGSEGIGATIIGEAVPAERGCALRARDGSLRALPTFARDEIARLFS